MAMKTMTMQPQTLSSDESFSATTFSTEALTDKRSIQMKKFAKVIAHSALVATLLTLLSTVASASAVWGN